MNVHAYLDILIANFELSERCEGSKNTTCEKRPNEMTNSISHLISYFIRMSQTYQPILLLLVYTMSFRAQN